MIEETMFPKQDGI